MEATRTCTIDGCQRSVCARGWCELHYRRNRVYGSPHTILPKGGPRPGSGRKRVAGPVGYVAAHQRIYADRGRADTHTCAHCGAQARDWAYDHGGNPVVGLKYSVNPSDYIPLCRTCHRRFDSERT